VQCSAFIIFVFGSQRLTMLLLDESSPSKKNGYFLVDHAVNTGFTRENHGKIKISYKPAVRFSPKVRTGL